MKFIILNISNHVWSFNVIKNMIQQRCIPAAIIEEYSNYGENRKKIYEKMINKEIKTNIKTLVQKNNIPYFCVNNHNNDETLNIIKQIDPDIIFLANTRIIKPKIYENAKFGTFNCHPDKLPGYRGSMVFIRRIIKNEPIGVTCHWINEIVDTGEIAYYSDVEKKDNLPEILDQMFDKSAEHFIRIINEYPDIPKIEQSIKDTPIFGEPDDDLIELAEEELKKCNHSNLP